MHDHGHFYHSHPHKPEYALLASFCTVATVSVLISIKAYAYYFSGSTAMLGTLVDSVVDLAVSLMLLFAVRLSLKPADKDHRFGHGKVEGIAALLQGAFMGGAGIFLVFEAFGRFFKPVELVHHELAIAVAVIAICMSILILAVQKFALRRAPSLAIEADHGHYKTDISLNGSVIVALLADLYGGPSWLDPAFGLLIASYFLWVAWSVTNKSLAMLMDKELPDEMRYNIYRIVEHHKQIHGMHDLRTRMSGMNIYISFDVELDPELSLQEAHDIVRELDHAILEHYPNAEIIIHMDPIGDTADARHSVDGQQH